ncbi:MAG: amino acid ABC transporter permease [Clostridia bacterium]|nr:amino acid ABC transporter permease [Clostridia bacterium]
MKNLLVIKDDKKKLTKLSSFTNVILVGLFILCIIIYTVIKLDYSFDFSVIAKYKVKFINGYIMTLEICIISLFISLVIGLINALALKGKIIFFRFLARLYVEILRGTPFLVQVLFFYFIIGEAFGLQNKFVVGFLILSFFSGAYVTEIIRGGIESIPQSQLVTANSLGFTKAQTYRYIIFPQVFRRILPSLAGQLSSLIKDSSLLSVISISEFTMKALEANAITYQSYEIFSFLALGYLVITIPVSLLSKWLERKYFYES